MSSNTTVIVAIIGPVVGFIAAMLTVERQNRQQLRRDAASARREYAWRAEEHFRPYLYDALAFARSATTAANQTSADVGDVEALDRCIDRCSSSPLTAAVADACGELRVLAVRFRAAVQLRHRLVAEQERVAHGPLDPHHGRQVASHGEDVQALADRVRAECAAVRIAVCQVVAQLQLEQGGRPQLGAGGGGTPIAGRES
jgi:hypothetical protein